MRVLFIIPRDPPPSLDGRGAFSGGFKSFVGTCLQKDPAARPTTKELAQHPFISGRSWLRKGVAAGLGVMLVMRVCAYACSGVALSVCLGCSTCRRPNEPCRHRCWQTEGSLLLNPPLWFCTSDIYFQHITVQQLAGKDPTGHERALGSWARAKPW
jgi:hypothetical protein